GRAKLIDLGLAKDVDLDLELTRPGCGLGTPHFMAPEQIHDAKNADFRCDIYGLGSTLYLAVTGELPFRARGFLNFIKKKTTGELVPPRKLVPELSQRVEKVILWAMSADPTRRPASCREFIEGLENTCPLPTPGRPATPERAVPGPATPGLPRSVRQ